MSPGFKNFLFCLLFLASTPAYGLQIYHWIDEHGVPNFSQEKPVAEAGDVEVLELDDGTGADHDPAEDRYGIEAQAERMAALREKMRMRREEQQRQTQYAVRQPTVQYPEPYRSYSHGIWLPPRYPLVPPRPEPPIARPYPTATLDPSYLSSR